MVLQSIVATASIGFMMFSGPTNLMGPTNGENNTPAPIIDVDRFRSFIFDGLLNDSAPIPSPLLRAAVNSSDRAITSSLASEFDSDIISIPYAEIIIEDSTLFATFEEVRQEGEAGIAIRTTLTEENDDEQLGIVSTTLTTLQTPTPRKVVQGTRPLLPWIYHSYITDGRAFSDVTVENLAAWGRATDAFGNGRLPDHTLCALSWSNQRLRCDAAFALERLNESFFAQFGRNLPAVSGYRTFEQQASVCQGLNEYGRCNNWLAAPPGRSNHGAGIAMDFGTGINTFGGIEHQWMRNNAHYFDWILPSWAQENGSKPEPWHWEFWPNRTDSVWSMTEEERSLLRQTHAERVTEDYVTDEDFVWDGFEIIDEDFDVILAHILRQYNR